MQPSEFTDRPLNPALSDPTSVGSVLDGGQQITQAAQQLPDTTQAPQAPLNAAPPAMVGDGDDYDGCEAHGSRMHLYSSLPLPATYHR
jgi:hypothetical protein